MEGAVLSGYLYWDKKSHIKKSFWHTDLSVGLVNGITVLDNMWPRNFKNQIINGVHAGSLQ